MRRSALLLALVAFLSPSGRPAAAGDFAFDLPELTGSYLGSPTATAAQRTTIDLGIPFAEIHSASLLLRGSLDLGLYGDLNEEGTWPLSVELFASLFDEGEQASGGSFASLGATPGDFELTIPFVGSSGEGPDFAALLDTSAQIEIDAFTPMLIGTAVLIEFPSLRLDSVSLQIDGQPRLDDFMTGPDFNHDGVVDHRDLAMWQAALAGGPEADCNGDGRSDGVDFLWWQRGFRDSELFQTIPETTTWLLAVIALLLGTPRRRPA